jgi:ribonuclease-3
MTATARAPYELLEDRIGHTFADRVLCESALTHKSWINERHGVGRTDNERLEFLGDAVLALVVSDLLMKNFPHRSEGELSKTRAAIVSEAGLARAAEGIGLGAWIFLGRGEDQAGGRRKPSILADALEALIGAVYLDGGHPAAHQAILRLFGALLWDAESTARNDFKSRLQERSQALLQSTPHYTVVGQEGPDHDKTFSVAISLGGREYGRASGKSKKEAEQSAAAQALDALEPKLEPEPELPSESTPERSSSEPE